MCFVIYVVMANEEQLEELEALRAIYDTDFTGKHELEFGKNTGAVSSSFTFH